MNSREWSRYLTRYFRKRRDRLMRANRADGEAVLRQVREQPAEQPEPKPNELPAVWDLVMADMRARDAKGVQTYRTRLQPHNGRDALRDALEEALDLCAYLRQAIYERDGK